MKWIGQHIVDFIARFRGDVYLEGLSESTQNHVIGIDANGKLYKQDNLDQAAQGIEGATDADVRILSDGEVIVKLDSDDDEATQKFKITNNADTVVASITEGGHVYLAGNIGNAGSDSDLQVESDGNMTFVIDRDDDETSQSFSFKNYTTEIANLDESGNLQIDGGLTTGTTSFVNSSGVIQVATQGTIDHDSLANFVANEHIDWTGASAGTIHSTNIPTLNQDTTGNAATATTLTAGDKTLGGIYTSKGYIVDGDATVTAGSDGVALHIDSADITDGSTSGSGTATTYNHIVFENPRVLATNSSVTTTNASTVYIKGAPVAGTNQTFTNAYALYVAAGLSYFGGDISLTGNILPGITEVKILPSDFIPDDAGRPAMMDDTGSDRWLESHSTSKLYASVDIPAGFKATHVDIYGSATSAITVYEADVNSKTVTSKGTGNIGTQIDITDVNSDATNYILIELAQASGEEVYGGKLTIAKI